MTRTTPVTYQEAADTWYHRHRAWREATAAWSACPVGTPEERVAWRRQRDASDALTATRREMEAAAAAPTLGGA